MTETIYELAEAVRHITARIPRQCAPITLKTTTAERRKAEGLCCRCGAERESQSFLQCNKCREREQRRKKEIYANRKK